MIKLNRIYDQPAKGDGLRILVERFWPRGMSKEKEEVQVWLKEIAPSAELRKWYQHGVSKWKEFQEQYRAELKVHGDLV